jgi:hypothetical protein
MGFGEVFRAMARESTTGAGPALTAIATSTDPSRTGYCFEANGRCPYDRNILRTWVELSTSRRCKRTAEQSLRENSTGFIKVFLESASHPGRLVWTRRPGNARIVMQSRLTEHTWLGGSASVAKPRSRQIYQF